MTDVFVGLDGEMTGGGRDPAKRPAHKFYQLVQIGAAFRDDIGEYHMFYSPIGYDKWDEEPEAMEVHKMTADEIRASPRPQVVDAQLRKKFDEWGIRRAIPVGFGVAGFDMPFVREYLPLSSQHLSMRSVDLTGIAFLLQEVTGHSFQSIKAASKQYALKKMPKPTETFKWHNAGFDSLAALYAWEYFQRIVVVRETHKNLGDATLF